MNNVAKFAEEKYESVLARLNVDVGNEWLRARILEQLKEEVDRRIITLIWKHMTDAQAVHFRDFAGQSAVVSPTLSSEEVLMDFALLYDDLVAKVSDDLDKFLEEFVAKVNGN